MKTLGIGEIARRADVTVETVRYYERKGLLQEPDRKSSGYRKYDEGTVLVLKFIARAKEFGFTLREIKELLDLRSNANASREDVRQQMREKITEIETEISELQRMRDGLKLLVSQCDDEGPLDGCPILKALAEVSSN